ncbi:MAG: acetoacetate--CoA ligase [Alphaproteobacteria bacterium]|nr:acetoacetate--CoA ligase [Alphaproteobacteria bacterium]
MAAKKTRSKAKSRRSAKAGPARRRAGAAEKPLWQPSPSRIAAANLSGFRARVAEDWGVPTKDFPSLWRWSVAEPAKFWTSLWDYCGVIAETRGKRALASPSKMPGAKFFPDAKLNFAENLLRRRDSGQAMVFWGEDKVRRSLTWGEVYDTVSRLAQALEAEGVKPGDRVAGYLPNLPETAMAMMAASSIGAIWSSCSPDFGVQGVLDRFGQIEPVVLFTSDGYFYGGKTFSSVDKLPAILAKLPTVRRAVVIPYTGAPMTESIDRTVTLAQFLAPYAPRTIAFERLPFDHPLFIMFSSGTTGVPKCIVHGQGGTLLQHLKEHRLHCDIKPGDRVFYFTTCGWMMWNWLITALASEATLLLYDGNPFHPTGNILFDYADQESMTLFGTSAKYIDAVNKAGLKPIETHRLRTVRAMTSTGSPLVPESFDFVYRAIKKDLHLASISGGTDIISCFVLGDPTGPVWRGEIQQRGLGLAVDVFGDDGKPLRGDKGELVCTKPFPCMPIGFWNDPDGQKYHNAYFARFKNVWCHGDYIEITGHGGLVIHGRSDAVLNPGGVRIGTAEIYRQVEQLDEVVESIVIGQDWADGDVRVVLFVRLRPGLSLDDNLTKKIKDQIRRNTTPRHVPAKIVHVADIPRTKSGKIVELAVRDVVHGRAVKNKEALANPEALDLYKDLAELRA